ncbi:hypothetical protein [Lentzea aerocolonigenes]|uniref:hypothetical protein n=1 Tax=Lentzea aerocolonigenes TaxID=68170 RepID=UPI0012E0CDCC|nr:hypothetical protein [Lentzea aerocolonigenes]
MFFSNLSAIVTASYVPDQYLHHNGKAIDRDGNYGRVRSEQVRSGTAARGTWARPQIPAAIRRSPLLPGLPHRQSRSRVLG